MSEYMDDGRSLPYFAGESIPVEAPLHRFLPPVPTGALAYGLSTLIPPHTWVIDPFGASPHLAVELAQAGYQALIICNNPILQFYLELICSAPKRQDFIAALADFAKEKQETMRVETYLQSLYETKCPHCGNMVQAQAFTWRKEPLQMRSKILSCPNCGSQGEFTVDAEDVERYNSTSLDALHRARALQRVNINPDVLKAAEDVSQVYTARALNFLFTFINRIERMDTSPFHKKLLNAILFFLLDEGNSMWSWPLSKTRPKILSTPGQYREPNLWLLIDKAIEQWSAWEKPVAFSVWPDVPQGDQGVCLYKGRISGFKADSADRPLTFSAACTVFPRPNQAFWSLTAVWSGWLWGKNAVLPMKSALERRRFDWSWYASAVHQTLTGLHGLLSSGTPLLGAVSEAEPAFLASTLYAAENAGFSAQSSAMRSDEEVVQVLWKNEPTSHAKPPLTTHTVCVDAIRRYLMERGEPADELEVTAACLSDLTRRHLLSTSEESLPYHVIKDIQQEVAGLLSENGPFTSLQIQHGAQENRLYWLKNEDQPRSVTLSDRVECAFREQFWDVSSLDPVEVDRALCARFPGNLTPSSTLVKQITAAYTEHRKESSGPLHWLPEFERESLTDEKQRTVDNLHTLGMRLNYAIHADPDVIWQDDDLGDPQFTFSVIDHAAVSAIAFQAAGTGTRVIVLPDLLLGLLMYKLNSNPILSAAMNDHIKILTYQNITDLCNRELLQRSDFFSALEGSQSGPQQPSQISFFPL